MVLESTFICVDNSEFMRNGDFLPTRLVAQHDAVNVVCTYKTRGNPENNVGLLTMAGKRVEVLSTLTTDTGRIMAKLHLVRPEGAISFSAAIRVAHLALKHRQGKNHKTRIVAFVGSPLEEDEKDLEKLAKKLKKEKVKVDVVNFGEISDNTDKLTTFITTLNGKEDATSSLVTVPPGTGPTLSESIKESPIIKGEDAGEVGGGAGGGRDFDFGIDADADPELALALRVSMEEQRQRQADEARRNAAAPKERQAAIDEDEEDEEAAQLAAALALSRQNDTSQPRQLSDFGSMTEEEQIAMAMQMSLQAEENASTPGDASNPPGAPKKPSKKKEDKKEDNENKNSSEDRKRPRESEGSSESNPTTPGRQGNEEKKPRVAMDDSSAEDDDYSEVMNDPAFLQSVLENLPGVDPQSDAIKDAVSSLSTGEAKKKEDKKKNEEK